jgi:hypothetical protein
LMAMVSGSGGMSLCPYGRARDRAHYSARAGGLTAPVPDPTIPKG